MMRSAMRLEDKWYVRQYRYKLVAYKLCRPKR